MNRPDFEHLVSGEEFNQWYWLKEEMVQICKKAGLPSHGSKFTLRDRIMYALDHNGAVKPEAQKPRKSSTFNWAKETLDLNTVITDNVSFGPNFRNFMKTQVDGKFSCHSDFMDWVKASPGKTLQEAILKWEELNSRKNNPDFRREIASHNMLCQYIRDFLDDNPGSLFKDAKYHWTLKKRLPMKDGFVRYERSDLDLKS